MPYINISRNESNRAALFYFFLMNYYHFQCFRSDAFQQTNLTAVFESKLLQFLFNRECCTPVFFFCILTQSKSIRNMAGFNSNFYNNLWQVIGVALISSANVLTNKFRKWWFGFFCLFF